MNNKLLNAITVLVISIFVVSCTKKNEETNTNATPQTPTVETTTVMQIGTPVLGYVNIPSDFIKFRDLDERVKDLQYSDKTGATIVTMNIFDKSGLSPEQLKTFGAKEAAGHVQANLKTNGAADVKESVISIQKYEAYQLLASYTDNSQLIAWLFQAEDGEVHYLAVESPDKEKFQNLCKQVAESFSLTEK